MADFIDLAEFRLRKKAHQAYCRWQRRLNYTPEPDTALENLPDRVLMILAELDQGASVALYDLVLGVRGWGAGENFYGLPPDRKMQALDAYLFLADQIRYEMMRRLGWVEGLAGEGFSLLELAEKPGEIQSRADSMVPRLTPAYHRYPELESRLGFEPLAVVRSLTPEALRAFRNRLSGQ